MTHSRYAYLAAGIALLAAATPAQITWTPRLEAAMEAAKAKKQVVFVSVNMDGERDNDEIMAVHLRDPRIAQLSKLTQNVFCSGDAHKKSGNCPRCRGTKCADHTANDGALQTLLEAEAPVVTPQQIFFGPDGKVLLSLTGAITAGELEWMWVEALREVDPTLVWEAVGRTRAPARLKRGSADKGPRGDRPPGKKEMQQALKDIKKLSVGRGGRGGGRGGRGGGRNGWTDMMAQALKNSRVLVRSGDKKALDWGRNTLRSYRFFRNRLLGDIGRLSPTPWAPVLEEFLESDSGTTRKATAMALEKLHNPKSVRALRRAAKAESEVDVHGRMLRALAACAPTKGAVIRDVTKAATKHSESILRCHAIVATGLLEERAAITKTLRAGLEDQDPIVRSVAAYVIAIRQDREMLDPLALILQAETDSTVKAWMEKALSALRTGSTSAFDDFLGKTLDQGNAAGDGEGERGEGRPGRGRTGGEEGAGEGAGAGSGRGSGRRRR